MKLYKEKEQKFLVVHNDYILINYLMLWARSLGWLERSADNREVRSSNLRGPIK